VLSPEDPIVLPHMTPGEVDYEAELAVIIGLITPPFGYNLFYFKGLGYEEVSMSDIYRSVMPFVPMMLIALALVIRSASVTQPPPIAL
jgi:TRAP-type mannitol/chloroaromatic compound transport system permease large subunit